MPAESRRVSQDRAPSSAGRAGHGSRAAGHGSRSSHSGRSNHEGRANRPGRPNGAGSRRVSSLIDAPGGTAAACVLLGPIGGAFLGVVVGGYSGPVFALVAVLTAMAATAVSTPSGQWWVVPAVAPVIWIEAVLAELVLHSPHPQDGKARAAAVAHATIHSFPVLAVATFAASAVVVAGRIVVVRRGVAHV